jgi:biopolymer transport protein ExbD
VSHAVASRRQGLRRHQHHADARSCIRAAGDLHHHDHRDRAGDNLPKASAAPSLAQQTTKAITVSNDGKIFLDTVPVTLSELEQRLVQQRTITPEFPIVVRGDSQTQYQNVIDVLDLLGRLNFTQVGMATKPLVR